jgi:hypothetical protein
MAFFLNNPAGELWMHKSRERGQSLQPIAHRDTGAVMRCETHHNRQAGLRALE